MEKITDQPSASQVQDLKNTLFMVTGFHKELSTERQLLSTLTGQIANCTKQFEQNLRTLEEQLQENKREQEEYREKLEIVIQRESQKMAKLVGTIAGESFIGNSQERLDSITKKLGSVCGNTETTINKYKDILSHLSTWVIASMLIATTVGGLLGGGIAWWRFSNSQQATLKEISTQMKREIGFGELLINAWPHLDPKEREKLVSAAEKGKKR